MTLENDITITATALLGLVTEGLHLLMNATGTAVQENMNSQSFLNSDEEFAWHVEQINQ